MVKHIEHAFTLIDGDENRRVLGGGSIQPLMQTWYSNSAPSQGSFFRLVRTMTSSADEGEILTLRQVAEFLKVTDRTIYRLAAAKKIPALKVGGTWRFSKAEIAEWIQQQTQGGKADKT